MSCGLHSLLLVLVFIDTSQIPLTLISFCTFQVGKVQDVAYFVYDS